MMSRYLPLILLCVETAHALGLWIDDLTVEPVELGDPTQDEAKLQKSMREELQLKEKLMHSLVH